MLNVVLADDEQQIRMGLEKILSRWDGELRIAGSYANGLEAVRGVSALPEDGVDVLITDIAMPVMDGLKLIEQLKKRLPGIQVIVLSGYNEFEYARQAMRFGAMDYLLKPVDKQELYKLLQDCAARKLKRDGGDGGTAGRPADASSGEENAGGGAGLAEQVKRALQAAYQRPFNLQQLAEQVGYNASYVSKMFKHQTGETITDYLTRLRIEKARQLLEDHPDLKVYEVAPLVGYSDAIYFQKLYKRLTGTTPRSTKYKTGKTNDVQ